MKIRGLVFVALMVASALAHAQSATNGKALYKLYCQSCHTVDPSTAVEPFNNIMEAAGDPARIAAAAEVDPSQMGWITSTLTASELADLAAYLATFAGSAGTVDVVEFYSLARDHYFMTASAQEAADLDAGVHPGWARTGFSFKASASAIDGTGPVCRFYLPPAFGDSHFYSASTVECSSVGATYPGFVYETAAALYAGIPDMVTGTCVAGTTPIYRVWNNRPDTNHRYTTSLVIRQQMLSQGWIAEGYGPTQVIMCAL